MRNKVWPYLAGFGVLLVVLAVGLSFITPWAPLFVLLSLVIQAPIVLIVTTTSMNSSYRDRAFERRKQYEKDNDAEAWLAAEQKEAAGVGYKYFSRATKSYSALNRAEALVALGRGNEAAELLAQVEEGRLDHRARQRFSEAVAALRQQHEGERPR